MAFAQRVQRAGRRVHRRYWKVPVVYQSVDGDFTASIDMVPGLRATQSTTQEGVLVDQMMTEWIIEADILSREPKRGDTITWSGSVYRVVHPGGGREYDQRDPYAEGYRIHTVILGDPFGDVPPPVDPPVPTMSGYGQGTSFYGSSDGTVYGSPSDAS